MIAELRNESKDYVTAINGLVEEEKISVKINSQLNDIFNSIEKIEKNIGFPVYASTGEIIFLRNSEERDISKGFLVNRKSEWFLILDGLMSKNGYSLTYQWPFGTSIESYLVNICLSFKSSAFKDDGLSNYFSKNS